MSLPIALCLISRAARGSESAFNRLVEAMEINLKGGHFSVYPCKCDPPCPAPSDEELESLDKKMLTALAIRKQAVNQHVLKLEGPTPCCNASALLKCGKVYKCPCGKTTRAIY